MRGPTCIFALVDHVLGLGLSLRKFWANQFGGSLEDGVSGPSSVGGLRKKDACKSSRGCRKRGTALVSSIVRDFG